VLTQAQGRDQSSISRNVFVEKQYRANMNKKIFFHKLCFFAIMLGSSLAKISEKAFFITFEL